jgi:hypothetical protein
VLLAEKRADFAPEPGLTMVLAPLFPFQDQFRPEDEVLVKSLRPSLAGER